MPPFKVRQSTLKTWRKCRRAAHYKLVEFLRPKLIRRPLKFGTLIHNLTEAGIKGTSVKKYLTTLTPEEIEGYENREEYGNILEDASDIMIEYRRKWKGDGIVYCKGPTGERAEHKFEMDLCKGIILTGKIDFVAKTEDRRRWMGEHKTFKKEWSEEDRWRNVQSSLYINAWTTLTGKRLDGILWDYIYSKPPTFPQLTKTGKISEKAIVTLPITVNRFLAANELTSDSPGADTLIAAGEEGVDRYFQRIFIPRNERVEKMVWKDAIATAKEMRAKLGVSRERTIDYGCNMCEFKKLCNAALTGGDVKFIKRNFYYVDEAEREETEREEEDAAA